MGFKYLKKAKIYPENCLSFYYELDLKVKFLIKFLFSQLFNDNNTINLSNLFT